MNRREMMSRTMLGALAVAANPFRAFGGVAPLLRTPKREQPESIEFIVDRFDVELFARYCGTFNANVFLGNPPGTVRLNGSDWSRRADGKWDARLNFDYPQPESITYWMANSRPPLYHRKPFKPLLKIGKRVT